MDMSKFGPPPQLVAAFCLCALFMFIHHLSVPAEPSNFGMQQPVQDVFETHGTSLLAVHHGRIEKSSHHSGKSHRHQAAAAKSHQQQSVAEQATHAVRQEEQFVNEETNLDKKEKTNLKEEKHLLIKEANLLDKEEVVFKRGDSEEVDRLSAKIGKIVAREQKDFSSAKRFLSREHKKEAFLSSLFQEWKSSKSSPSSSKLARQHHKHLATHHTHEEKLRKLEQNQAEVEREQEAFVQRRDVFENSRVHNL
jgi:hypothetical protein